MSIETCPGIYDNKFPFFARPEVISEYAVGLKSCFQFR